MAAAPKTIAAFQQLAQEKGLPLKQMRFFLGEDCKETKCFGIYHDAVRDRYVVYKNKADGSRAVRYDGPDEQEACRILFDKMAEEIQLRRDRKLLSDADAVDAAAGQSAGKTQKKGVDWSALGLFLLIAALIGGAVWYAVSQPADGYYHKGSDVYYHCDDHWYWFNNGMWLLTDVLDEHMDDYWYGSSDPQFDQDTRFESTSYYQEAQDAHNSDSWSSSDFSDWSSSDTDWSSDW